MLTLMIQNARATFIQSLSRRHILHVGMPVFLALITFIIYLPSLQSDFVYDAKAEILKEGFITSFSNLTSVFSPNILSANLMLATRPGQLLYLMLIAAVCGRHPFGYHLCSNLLHSVNVALLFLLLRRLIKSDGICVAKTESLQTQMAVIAVCVIFALHPICVESVAEVSYSSSLLVAFFTLISLLAATYFNQQNILLSLGTGAIGMLGSFASVTCKESGIITPLILIVYWFLYRRGQAKLPWFLFLISAAIVSVAFLAARFYLARRNLQPLEYLGGSFYQYCRIQPRVWVFMVSQIFWPAKLSADYMPQNITISSTVLAINILFMVAILQVWLACRSRIGALGVAIYWFGLSTVSNLVPLYRFLADRFYYLPLIGCVMQFLAMLLICERAKWGARIGSSVAIVVCLSSIVPLAFLTIARQNVFANDSSLWTATLQASPCSPMAHNGVAIALLQNGQSDKAIAEFRDALAIAPDSPEVHDNLGSAYAQLGKIDEAIVQYQKALELRPDYPEAHNNLGLVLYGKGRVKDAILQYRLALGLAPYYDEAYNNLGVALRHEVHLNEAQNEFMKALQINSENVQAHVNLGNIYFQSGHLDDAILHYQQALMLKPDYGKAKLSLESAELAKKLETDLTCAHNHNSLGINLVKTRHLDAAMIEFKTAIEINPESAEAHTNLGNLLYQKGLLNEAMIEFNKALEIDPNSTEALTNMGIIFFQRQQIQEAIDEYQKALKINPEYIKIHNNLGVALIQEGLLKEAVVQFQEAVQLDPSCSEAQSNLAKINAILKRNDTTSVLARNISNRNILKRADSN